MMALQSLGKSTSHALPFKPVEDIVGAPLVSTGKKHSICLAEALSDTAVPVKNLPPPTDRSNESSGVITNRCGQQKHYTTKQLKFFQCPVISNPDGVFVDVPLGRKQVSVSISEITMGVIVTRTVNTVSSYDKNLGGNQNANQRQAMQESSSVSTRQRQSAKTRP